jgi:phosphatidylethanolamine-binding protein (PEBP) family uncharacterized protein
MRTLLTWTSIGVALTLGACSEADPPPSESGSAGSPASGSGGVAVTAGSGGSAAGSSAGGAAGQAPLGGAGGSVAGASGAAGSGGAAGGGGVGGGGGGMSGSGAGGTAGAGGGAGFVLTSPAFEHVETCSNDNKAPCKLFPSTNVMTSIGGMNQSPELNWGAGPAGTMSYVLCLHDTTNGNTHWCLWNIPAATRQLPANLGRQKMPATPAGSSQDSFSTTDDGYQGPGARGNVYQFRLFALSSATYTPPNAENRETVYDALETNPNNVVLGVATLRGRSNPN